MFRNQDQGTPASSRTISAADVVLYGVNIVLPLMSQDLLKVRLHTWMCCIMFRLDLLQQHVLWTNTDPVPTLFQFPSLCNQYYKLITFICEIFPEKIPQLPEDLFKSLMFSLELGMTSYPSTASQVFLLIVCVHFGQLVCFKQITQLEQCIVAVKARKQSVVYLWSLMSAFRMSSEINQLCLEALSPLAEQCAKNQEKDTPLFIATRHFLKVRHTGLGFF